MSKTRFISGYIMKCNTIIEENNVEGAKELESEIVAVFENEIQNITTNLEAYWTFGAETKINYIADIKLLKAKLENYKGNIKQGLVTQKSVSAKTNININNNATANSIATINVSTTIEQTIKDINKLSETGLTKTEKEDLEDKLTALEKAVNDNNKEKAIRKYINILNFIVDKGPKTVLLVTKCLGFIADKVQDLIK